MRIYKSIRISDLLKVSKLKRENVSRERDEVHFSVLRVEESRSCERFVKKVKNVMRKIDVFVRD